MTVGPNIGDPSADRHVRDRWLIHWVPSAETANLDPTESTTDRSCCFVAAAAAAAVAMVDGQRQLPTKVFPHNVPSSLFEAHRAVHVCVCTRVFLVLFVEMVSCGPTKRSSPVRKFSKRLIQQGPSTSTHQVPPVIMVHTSHYYGEKRVGENNCFSFCFVFYIKQQLSELGEKSVGSRAVNRKPVLLLIPHDRNYSFIT